MANHRCLAQQSYAGRGQGGATWSTVVYLPIHTINLVTWFTYPYPARVRTSSIVHPPYCVHMVYKLYIPTFPYILQR